MHFTQYMNVHDCKKELQEMDLKATPARVALLRLFESSDQPLDAQTMIDFLEKKDIKTDPATVFRIVNMFTDKGLIKQIQLHEGKFRYELSDKEDHHHLICQSSGKIEDIEDTVIPALEKHIEKKHNFTVRRHALEFFGLCSDCQK